jgi:hypothetical protein
MSVVLPGGDEDISYELRPTIYLLLTLPKIFYSLLVPFENDSYIIGRLIGFILSLITIAACLWQIILIFFRKKIPLPFVSLVIFILCLLDATIPVSHWVGSEIHKLDLGYYLWLLGFSSTTIGLGIICYDRIQFFLYNRKMKAPTLTD